MVDSTPTGRLAMPVLTLHAIHDPTAFVELESAYREIVDRAGSGDRLVQTFSDDAEHSYLSEPQYPAVFTALMDWVDKGEKPTPEKVARLCKGYERDYGHGGKQTCRIQVGYQPPPLSSRVPPR